MNQRVISKIIRGGKDKMKHLIIFCSLLFFCVTADAQQLKKDGTPDMRYKENKKMYGNSYSTPSYLTPNYSSPNYNKPERSYNNGGSLYMQNGYMKSNGTYVAPHLKTKPDSYQWNNYNELYGE